MKRLSYVTLLFFAFVFINTACEKNDDVNPIITIEELIDK